MFITSAAVSSQENAPAVPGAQSSSWTSVAAHSTLQSHTLTASGIILELVVIAFAFAQGFLSAEHGGRGKRNEGERG